MPRILGVDIPNNKHVNISLTYIYGIGPSRANEICRRTGIDPMMKAGDLSESDIAAILQVLQDSYIIEGDLRRQVAQNIRRLTAIGAYRGLRHRRNLPVRGQRTRTNARTRKGGKKTIGAIRDRSQRKQTNK
mgnify:CR=1 FL=1|jgi:small subunit ribosomal protein S13